MTQKIVINIMNCKKCRSKALRIASRLPGVESASLKGNGRSQIEVTGDGVDPVQLTCLLRKRMGYAELDSLNATGGGGGTNPPTDVKPAVQPCVCPYIPPYNVCVVPCHTEVSYCFIL